MSKITDDADMNDYLEKWVYGFSSHFELLDHIGTESLAELVKQSTIIEGYRL